MKKFKTQMRPTRILKYLINKDLLKQADTTEIHYLRGLLAAFSLQGFISPSSHLRFIKIIQKALKGELKLNINKDKR